MKARIKGRIWNPKIFENVFHSNENGEFNVSGAAGQYPVGLLHVSLVNLSSNYFDINIIKFISVLVYVYGSKKYDNRKTLRESFCTVTKYHVEMTV